MVLEAFCFGAVCASVRLSVYASVVSCRKFVNMIPYKLLVEFRQIYDFGAVGERGELITIDLRSKGQRSSSQWGQIWSDKHFGRHFLTYIQNAWMCLVKFIIITHFLPGHLVTFSRLWVQLVTPCTASTAFDFNNSQNVLNYNIFWNFSSRSTLINVSQLKISWFIWQCLFYCSLKHYLHTYS